MARVLTRSPVVVLEKVFFDYIDKMATNRDIQNLTEEKIFEKNDCKDVIAGHKALRRLLSAKDIKEVRADFNFFIPRTPAGEELKKEYVGKIIAPDQLASLIFGAVLGYLTVYLYFTYYQTIKFVGTQTDIFFQGVGLGIAAMIISFPISEEILKWTNKILSKPIPKKRDIIILFTVIAIASIIFYLLYPVAEGKYISLIAAIISAAVAVFQIISQLIKVESKSK